MPRKFTLIGLHVFLPINRCAHECKYCLWGVKRHTKLEFERAARLIERLAEWKYAHRPRDYLLNFDPGYSRNVKIDDLKAYNELNERIGNGKRYSRNILLGGLRFRRPDDQAEWVRRLRDIGVETMTASLAGHGTVHDDWNDRKGDFSHLMSLMRSGKDVGIRSIINLFVTKNTAPQIDDVRTMIQDELGASANCIAKTYNYMGSALSLEDQRITERIRDDLPCWVQASDQTGFSNWRSEREWIEVIMQEPEQAITTQLRLVLTDDNIDRLETMPAQRIISELENHIYGRYRSLPNLKELCERYSDPSNRRIYQNRLSLDGLWQHRSGSGEVSFSRYLDLLRDVPNSMLDP